MINELMQFWDYNDDKIIVFEIEEIVYVLNQSEFSIVESFGEDCEQDLIDLLLDLGCSQVCFNNLEWKHFEEDYAEYLEEDRIEELKEFFTK